MKGDAVDPEHAGPKVSTARAVAAGVVAAAVATTAGELAAQLVPGARSPVVAVGNRVVQLASPGLRDQAVGTLGTADKPALVAGVLVVVALVGGAAGALARRRSSYGVVLVLLLAALAGAAVATDAGGSAVGAASVASVLALAGTAALALLTSPASPSEPNAARRVFLLRAAALTAAAAVLGTTGRYLSTRVDVERLRSAIRLRPPARPAPGDLAAARLDVEGLSPVLTPNSDFYRIDTALTVPRIDPQSWSLAVVGMVDRPLQLSYRELLGMRQYEADITLQCVSNEVGADLVGTARWQGVLLTDLLSRAGVQADADQVVGRSVDDFTAGFPTAVAVDGRAAMVALGMNGVPLPQRHGFPARLVVPGLYGYVSATKWLSRIELTTLAGFDGFWVPRGWSKLGPIKIASRIDVPRDSAKVPAGEVVVAGVAWAPGPGRGIARVQVRVDGAGWQDAELAAPLSQDAWRQWRLTWSAGPGRHVLEVRATDGQGVVQTSEVRPPRPDGATGFHTISVRVGS